MTNHSARAPISGIFGLTLDVAGTTMAATL
jgi:hypothetical protein